MNEYTTKIYDFIIVGGGTCGCLVANRLSSISNCNVLLIESGGKNDGLITNSPTGALTELFTGSKTTLWDDCYEIIDENTNYGRAANDNIIPLWKGKGLGGTSVTSLKNFEMGSKNDWDKFLSKYEMKYEDIEDDYKRIKNELKIIFSKIENKQFVEEIHNGFIPLPVVEKNSNTLFIKPIKGRKNLTILTNENVEKIIWNENNKTKAIGVKTNKNTYSVKKEIILCAGTFGTPTIINNSDIKLSGNFKDQPIVWLYFGNVKYKEYFYEKIMNYINIGINIVKEILGNSREVNNNMLYEESNKVLKIMSEPLNYLYQLYNYKNKYIKNLKNGFTIGISLKNPVSIGKIDFENKKIKTNCNSERKDMDEMIQNIREYVNTYCKSKRMIKYDLVMPDDFTEHNFDTDEYWEDYIKLFSRPHNSQIGSTAEIIDKDFRIKNISNVRIADASMLYDWIGNHMIGPLYVLSEHIANRIKKDNKYIDENIFTPDLGQGFKAQYVIIPMQILCFILYEIILPYYTIVSSKYRYMQIIFNFALIFMFKKYLKDIPKINPMKEILNYAPYACITTIFILSYIEFTNHSLYTKIFLYIIYKLIYLTRYLFVTNVIESLKINYLKNIFNFLSSKIICFIFLLHNFGYKTLSRYSSSEIDKRSTFVYINFWKTDITFPLIQLFFYTSIKKIIIFVMTIPLTLIYYISDQKIDIVESLFYPNGCSNIFYDKEKNILIEKYDKFYNDYIDKIDDYRYDITYKLIENKWKVDKVTKNNKFIELTKNDEENIHIARNNIDIGTYHTSLHALFEMYVLLIYKYIDNKNIKILINCFFDDVAFTTVWGFPVVFETLGILNNSFNAKENLLHNLKFYDIPKNYHYSMTRLYEQNMHLIENNYNYIITKKYDTMIRNFLNYYFDEHKIIIDDTIIINKFYDVFKIKYDNIKEILVVLIMMVISHSLSHSIQSFYPYVRKFSKNSFNGNSILNPSVFEQNLYYKLSDSPKSIKYIREELDNIAKFCDNDLDNYGTAHPRFIFGSLDI